MFATITITRVSSVSIRCCGQRVIHLIHALPKHCSCSNITFPCSTSTLRSDDLLVTGRRGITTSTRHLIPSPHSSPSYAAHSSHPALGTPEISTKQIADKFVKWMSPVERTNLQLALDDIRQEKALESGAEKDPKPTIGQLRRLAVANSIPFIGFGFLDNCIMILAGDYIDQHIGAALGISTMAAAAIGNLISDLCGIGLAGYVESFAIRMGFSEPALSTVQTSMSVTKNTAYLGRAVGIAIGCILGMFPLLFMNKHHDHDVEDCSLVDCSLAGPAVVAGPPVVS